MNQLIIDNSLLAVSLITAFITSKLLKERKAGLLLSVLLLFAPLLVFLNMWAHTVAFSAMNIRRMQAGSFQYSFTVYSHFLFGISFITLSGIAIHCTKKYLQGNVQHRRNIFLLNLALSVLFLPVGFINPLGFLPVLTSQFSTFVLLFDSGYRRKIRNGTTTGDVYLKRA